MTDGRPIDTAIGLSASSFGLITSMQMDVEYGMRITSLALGIIIGMVSLYRILRK